MTHEEKLNALAVLYDRTEEDWELRVSHCLTEPTCPTAIISCENKEAKFQYWRADRDTIQEAIEAVVDLAYRALFEQSDEIGVPWSEPTLRPVPSA
jgi:hypothetical protein